MLLAALERARVLPPRPNMNGEMLTNYPIDLDQKLLHGFIWMGSRPVHSRLVDTNASEHDIWSVRHVDAKDTDEFGHGLPQRLESSSHQPVERSYVSNTSKGVLDGQHT